MRLFVAAVLFVTIFAGCGKESSSSGGSGSSSSSSSSSTSGPSSGTSAPSRAWKPIEGGKQHSWAGAQVDYPGGWTTFPQGDVTYLVPPGVNLNGAIDEVICLAGAPTMKSLDDATIDQQLDNWLMSLLQVQVQREGSGKSQKMGGFDGKAWKWTAQLMDGRNVEIRMWGFVGSYVGSVSAIMTPDAMKKRMPELEQIVGSLRRPTTGGITSAKLLGEWTRGEGTRTALTGQHKVESLTFTADGRFHYHNDFESHGVFHSFNNSKDFWGTWKLAGDQLTGVADSGETGTFTIEARNAPEDGRAILVINGVECSRADGSRW